MLDKLNLCIFILSPVTGCLFAARELIHFYQLESYQFTGYIRAVLRRCKCTLMPGVVLAVFYAFIYFFADIFANSPGFYTKLIISLLVFSLSAISGKYVCKVFCDRQHKRPLVITWRVKRLYIVLFITCLVISIFFSRYHIILSSMALAILIPVWVWLAGIIVWPIERCIYQWYFNNAHTKLQNIDRLIRVGITGSYGKTSVKFILEAILSEKYKTFVTPASYNTPMGVARAIRESLESSHEIFICEMGARHVGDIKELCRLVSPTLGILTSIGPQHLETFKTMDRIMQTKYELIDALPDDGTAVFANDAGICESLYKKTSKPKILISVIGEADIYASNCIITSQGSEFELYIKGESQICKTKLLGEHNIQNILLAAAIGYRLGLNMTEITKGIDKLEPIPHRLQLISTLNGTTIIDDAYNANPAGTSAALKVIRSFPGRRIIVTPGMVELGMMEAELNRTFGRKIAESVDIAILIGRGHADPIADGLRDMGFDEKNIYRADSLNDSTMILQSIVRANDVILYENDLPDHYSER
jgi:UDP-N-acetylmuramoyl-tripeptide--D-alanyl-D-alanine ligase